mgnify:CR=1 FL=1
MEIGYSNSFRKKYKKLPVKVQDKFNAKLILFLEDPFNPLLNNHSVHYPYDGCRSINITGDLRAIYELKEKGLAHFLTIGSHNELYK